MNWIFGGMLLGFLAAAGYFRGYRDGREEADDFWSGQLEDPGVLRELRKLKKR